MGIKIKKPITTIHGIEILSDYYLTIKIEYNEIQSNLNIDITDYLNEESMKSNKMPLPTWFVGRLSIPYNRDVHGGDAYLFAHSYIKSKLLESHIDWVDSDVEIDTNLQPEVYPRPWAVDTHLFRLTIPTSHAIEYYYDKMAYLKSTCPYNYINDGRAIEIYLNYILEADATALQSDPKIFIENKPV